MFVLFNFARILRALRWIGKTLINKICGVRVFRHTLTRMRGMHVKRTYLGVMTSSPRLYINFNYIYVRAFWIMTGYGYASKLEKNTRS